MAGVPINDGNEVRAPRYLDLREGKIVGGKSVPYDSVDEFTDEMSPYFIPLTRRAEGLEFKVKNGAVIEKWQLVGGIEKYNLVKVYPTAGGGGSSGEIIQVKGSQFYSPTEYRNPAITTVPKVFINNLNRFMVYPDEYDLISGGGGIFFRTYNVNPNEYFFIYNNF